MLGLAIGALSAFLAYRKNRKTFAIIMAVWTGIALIGWLMSDSGLAAGPGILFLIIALVMKEKDENGNIIEKKTAADAGQGAFIPSDRAETVIPENVQETGEPTEGQESLPQTEELPGLRPDPFRENPAMRDLDETLAAAPVYPGEVKYCEYCGQKAKSGSKFCENCGAKLG